MRETPHYTKWGNKCAKQPCRRTTPRCTNDDEICSPVPRYIQIQNTMSTVQMFRSNESGIYSDKHDKQRGVTVDHHQHHRTNKSGRNPLSWMRGCSPLTHLFLMHTHTQPYTYTDIAFASNGATTNTAKRISSDGHSFLGCFWGAN